MTSGLPRATLSLILLAAFSISAWGRDSKALPNGQHLNLLDKIKSLDIRSFAERPLFAPTRRPAEVVEEIGNDTEAPTESAPEFVLLGVTSGPEGSVARIAQADGKNAHALRQGEVVEGWTVRSIEPSSVILAQGKQVTVLTIFRGDSKPANEADPAVSKSGIVFDSEDPKDAADPLKNVRVITPR